MARVLHEMYRFRMLVAGVMVALGVSTTYGFSLFTEFMKTKYGFTQNDITTISTVGNCLGYCAFLLGIIFDFAGPKAQILVSGSLAALGLVLFGFCFDDFIAYESKGTMVALFSVFNGIMFLGCPSLDGGSILPLMMNFPLDRGYVVIIQKTFSGLGTSVLMTYFNAWFKASEEGKESKFSAYSYFLAGQVLLVACVGAAFINLPCYSPCDYVKNKLSAEELEDRKGTLQLYMSQAPPRRRFYIGCSLVMTLLVFLTTTSIIGSFVTISVTAYRFIWACTILLLVGFSMMALPLQVFGPFRPADRETEYPGIGENDDREEAEALVEPTKENEQEVEGDKRKEEETGKKNHVRAQTVSGDPQYAGTFWSHLLTLDLWLFWICLFSMWGTGTVFIFNTAQIYRSKASGNFIVSNQSLYVALIGVGSALGRISSGVIDMFVSRRRASGPSKLYTTMFLPFSSLLLMIGFLLIVVMPDSLIVLPFMLAAMGNGLGWGLGVLCVRIVYADDIGKHYNFMWSSGIVATVALNRFMFGEIFDRKANKAGTSPFCDTPSCVTTQMWILMSCNIVSTLSAVLLHWRFSRFANAKLAELSHAPEEIEESINSTIADKEEPEM